ncbi:hypothetical protein ACP4OV_015557 [Aristida adscensionis]
MDDDGGLGIRNWGFYEPVKGNLGLQLMSSAGAIRGTTKSLLPNGTFVQHHGHHNALHQHQHQHQHQPQHTHHARNDGGVGVSSGMPTEPHSIHMDFTRNEAWLHPSQHQHSFEQKVLHARPVGPAGHVGKPGHGVHPRHGGHMHCQPGHGVHPRHGGDMHRQPTGYGMMPDAHGMDTLQMKQPQPHPQPQESPPCKEDHMPLALIDDHPVAKNEPPMKKRQQGGQLKSPKPKKPKKAAVAREDGAPKSPVPRRRGPKKNVEMVINGIDLDLSSVPTPVCSCTGTPQQCYRWGPGGWQSACCTTSISTFPLPMSTKRRGARIAGRKMSHGAFKKVLEKLVGEGYSLENPIDLKNFWAKHGTNKFVTIR